jgi:hypothetical protein
MQAMLLITTTYPNKRLKATWSFLIGHHFQITNVTLTLAFLIRAIQGTHSRKLQLPMLERRS